MPIQFTDVNKSYMSGEVPVHALKDVSFHIPDESIVVILGPSGSGKSTLMNVAGGIDQPDTGRIEINKHHLDVLNTRQLTDFRRRFAGFIFQQYNLIPTLTVKENVEVGRELSDHPLAMDDILEKVGMLDKQDKFPYQLSGGEQQRTAIARAVIKNPAFLLCDEPTGALDEATGKQILALLKYVNEQHKTTVMIITHNIGIGDMAHKVLKMKSGEIIETLEHAEPLDPKRVSWT
ncbi:ABC transporter ATP-binding protein [Thalassobacillus sp. CUG 92003]|uniref:ABC transporter ATP-binding protein n=1 Tax=Thalassobacillus sp. CUG 92003 TaxID=2736641 RepID=UPI0015E6682D|nr:ABC transporter ATP-binding protein [Thalassobacillus sp. CUG 92003]